MKPPKDVQDARDFLETTAARAIGLLHLLAIAAIHDDARNGPLTQRESDAIRALAKDTLHDLGAAVQNAIKQPERRAS